MSPNDSVGVRNRHEPVADLRQLVRVLRRRRWLVCGAILAGIGLAAVQTFLARPQYRSAVTLEIERRVPDVLEFTDVIGNDPAGYHDFYHTQYKILQSDRVLHSAVEGSQLTERPSFLDRRPSPVGQVVLAVKRTLGFKPGKSDPDVKAREFLRRRLQVVPVRNSHLVKVSVEDSDPVLARDLATAVSDAYQRFMFESRYQTTGEANAFLARDVARVQGEIDELERTLQSLARQRASIPARDGEVPIAEQSLATINAAYTEALTGLSASEARHLAVRDADPSALAEVNASELILDLRQQRARLEREARRIAERFGDDWPTLREVREQLKQANEQRTREERAIAERVRAAAVHDLESARATVDALALKREQQMNRVHDERRDSIEFAALRDRISTKRQVLTDLMARQGQTATSFRSKETGAGNIRVVDEAAVPRKPFSPRTGPNLAIGALLGIAAGIALGFTVEHLDRTVRSARDVRHATQLAVLSQIPMTVRTAGEPAGSGRTPAKDRNLDLASQEAPQSGFSEAFRNLRTSLLLSSPDAPPRHLVVTSSSPAEGKSTVAVNLAIVLTQLGRRVLLIDADLRRPRQHESLGLSREIGLSTYLSGNADFDALLQATSIDGLSAVSAGPTPPNPSELLGSPRMPAALEHATERLGFDHVIVDSPPTLAVADAVVLASICDGTILVARAGETATDRLSLAGERLREARARLTGVVLNSAQELEGYGDYAYYGETSGTTPRRGPREPRRFRRVG